ncbi:MAG: hypothetical protein ACR2PL_06180 [Dehalococcoidia bacterium]
MHHGATILQHGLLTSLVMGAVAFGDIWIYVAGPVGGAIIAVAFLQLRPNGKSK